MVFVREQAKVTENEIHSTIERLISAAIGMLRDREAVLINDVETIQHQKEKELQLQKDELEFLLSGIRHAVLFSEAMMKEGSDTEIVASHRQVVARMATLTSEREKAQPERFSLLVEAASWIPPSGSLELWSPLASQLSNRPLRQQQETAAKSTKRTPSRCFLLTRKETRCQRECLTRQ